MTVTFEVTVTSHPKYMMIKKFLPFLAFLLAAVLMRFWLSPLATRLPADYANELNYQAEDRFRDTPAGQWISSALIARSSRQLLAVSGDVALIQSDLYWYSDTGKIIFESTGLYGVDRHTRLNNPAYGDQPRSGQFLFPAHVEKAAYTFWDSQFIGPRAAEFDRIEARDGLQVYVFRFHAQGLDETDGYAALPGVPERYDAHTDGEGTFWVEPVSGIVVDYEEQGISYFVDRVSRERLSDFHAWSDHYTPETRAFQLALARAARLRILALEIGLPIGLLFAAFIALMMSLRGANGSERRSNLSLQQEIAHVHCTERSALQVSRSALAMTSEEL